MGLLKKMWERQMQTISEAKEKKAKEKEAIERRKKLIEEQERKAKERELKDKERKDYYARLDAAKTEAERAEIKREYRKKNPVNVSDYVTITAKRMTYEQELTGDEQEMLNIFHEIFRAYDYHVARRARDYVSLEKAKGWDVVRFHAGANTRWFSFVPADEDRETLRKRIGNKDTQAYWKIYIVSFDEIREFTDCLLRSAQLQDDLEKNS